MRESKRPTRRQTYMVLDMAALGHVARCSPDNRGFAQDPENFAVIEYVLNKVITWSQTYGTSDFLFCFDGKDLYRKKIFPEYKAHRHKREMDDRDKKDLYATYDQLNMLRDHILPALGFNNIYHHEGLEGDDLFAELVGRIEAPHRVIMLANDGDLWQLLAPHIEQHWPCRGKKYTYEWFTSQYGITPKQYIHVKAIAGCSTDNVPGCHGIGDVRALKYIRKEKLTTLMLDKIVDFVQSKAGKLSYELVTLPLPSKKAVDCQSYMRSMCIMKDKLSLAAINEVAEAYLLRGVASKDNASTELLFSGGVTKALF